MEGLEIDAELLKVLKRVPRGRFQEPPASEHTLAPDVVRQAIGHSQKCEKCQILLCEAGPFATRPKTQQEIVGEEEAQATEARRLTWRFYIVTVLGVAAFMGMQSAMSAWFNLGKDPDAVPQSTAQLQAVDTPGFHPLQLLIVALLVTAAFLFAEAWRIANLLWLDWTKAKEAVPFIGKRWAERSRRRGKAG